MTLFHTQDVQDSLTPRCNSPDTHHSQVDITYEASETSDSHQQPETSSQELHTPRVPSQQSFDPPSSSQSHLQSSRSPSTPLLPPTTAPATPATPSTTSTTSSLHDIPRPSRMTTTNEHVLLPIIPVDSLLPTSLTSIFSHIQAIFHKHSIVIIHNQSQLRKQISHLDEIMQDLLEECFFEQQQTQLFIQCAQHGVAALSGSGISFNWLFSKKKPSSSSSSSSSPALKHTSETTRPQTTPNLPRQSSSALSIPLHDLTHQHTHPHTQPPLSSLSSPSSPSPSQSPPSQSPSSTYSTQQDVRPKSISFHPYTPRAYSHRQVVNMYLHHLEAEYIRNEALLSASNTSSISPISNDANNANSGNNRNNEGSVSIPLTNLLDRDGSISHPHPHPHSPTMKHTKSYHQDTKPSSMHPNDSNLGESSLSSSSSSLSLSSSSSSLSLSSSSSSNPQPSPPLIPNFHYNPILLPMVQRIQLFRRGDQIHFDFHVYNSYFTTMYKAIEQQHQTKHHHDQHQEHHHHHQHHHQDYQSENHFHHHYQYSSNHNDNIGDNSDDDGDDNHHQYTHSHSLSHDSNTHGDGNNNDRNDNERGEYESFRPPHGSQQPQPTHHHHHHPTCTILLHPHQFPQDINMYYTTLLTDPVFSFPSLSLSHHAFHHHRLSTSASYSIDPLGSISTPLPLSLSLSSLHSFQSPLLSQSLSASTSATTTSTTSTAIITSPSVRSTSTLSSPNHPSQQQQQQQPHYGLPPSIDSLEDLHQTIKAIKESTRSLSIASSNTRHVTPRSHSLAKLVLDVNNLTTEVEQLSVNVHSLAIFIRTLTGISIQKTTKNMMVDP